VARAVARNGKGPRRSLLDVVLRRPAKPVVIDGGVFRPAGEDVGKAFRY